jgi:hypothetical protein
MMRARVGFHTQRAVVYGAERAAMKFSIIYEAQTVDTSRETEFRPFHDIVDQCLEAERKTEFSKFRLRGG